MVYVHWKRILGFFRHYVGCQIIEALCVYHYISLDMIQVDQKRYQEREEQDCFVALISIVPPGCLV